MSGMNRYRLLFGMALVGFLLFGCLQPASAQTRINDDDLARLMQNLKDDAKSFRSPFNDSLKHSTIRKTSQEKDARRLGEQFQQQTDTAWKTFKKSKGNGAVTPLLDTAQQIDKLVYGLRLDGETTSRWEKIKIELKQVSDAFGIPQPVVNNFAPGTAPNSSGVSCLQSVGAERAKRLADECTTVSSATHPPCNMENSCVLILGEIKRGCSLLGRNAPEFCAEYK